ncbi:MAG: alpha/beta hydrolase fold domain-containing protein [Planctomycetes bacterium]|nr:alpha/beta hydrolase fold domain-containing protein [Planctomycetota bacterium]
MLRILAASVFALPLCAQSTTFPSLTYATVTVGGSPLNLLLDLVVPVGTGPWPVMVWVHGGGWQGGSRLPIPSQATRLVARGYAVASIDYRLSGQAIWPAQIQDCKAAIRYLRANAATWSLDGNRIGVMGSSAGGHLVAALATMGNVGPVNAGAFAVDLEGSVGRHVGVSSRVQCAFDLFGPTNMLLANDFPTFDHDAAASPESQLIGGALQSNPEKWATVDPISFLTPDDPPLLVMHGTDDTTVPFHESELLVKSAAAIGHDATFFPVQDNGHGGPGFSAADATAVSDAFFDRVLRDLPDVVVSVAATDAVGDENGDPVTFTLSRTGPTTSPLLVRLSFAGDARLGDDYAVAPLLATIPAGQSSTSLTIVPVQDALVEGDQSVELRLVPADTHRIGHAASRAIATIVDDDAALGLPVVTLVSVDAAATEAAGNPGAVRFVRTGSTAAPLTVGYELAGTAVPGVDFVAPTGTATIPAGSATTLVVVTPMQDVQREPGETVVFSLAPGTTYVRGAARSAHVVIADDDRSLPLPVVGVIATDRSAGEPDLDGAFTITRTGGTLNPLAVTFTIGGTAANGVDYQAIAGTAVIPAGAAWVRVPVTILDDALQEGPENVVLTIVPSATYVVGAAATQQLWLDDDEAPVPAASPVVFAMSPLQVGRTAVATVNGGLPFGYVALWFGLRPAYAPLPPLGTVQFDLLLGAPFAIAAFDANGGVTLPMVFPLLPSLTGLECWWQCVAETPAAPFLALSDVAFRAVVGVPAF